MKKIDEYIELSKNKESINRGGRSAAYSFGDLILLKSLNRKQEEEVAKIANEKNEKGVRTPKHLAIKKEYIDGYEYYWTLQEKAKGVILIDYYGDTLEQNLKFLHDLSNAPDCHYEKAVSDLCELFNMGLDLSPYNIFYDNSKTDGGYTFIDLEVPNSTPIDFESLDEIRKLFNCTKCLYCSYHIEANEVTKKQAKELVFNIQKRFFVAFEKIIPNFEKFRRYILRSYSIESLEYFKEHGIEVGNLTLNAQEQKEFNERLQIKVDENIEEILRYGQVFLPIKRFEFADENINNDWRFHPFTKTKNPEPIEYESDLDLVTADGLEEFFNQLLAKKIFKVAKTSADEHILEAKQIIIRQRKKANLEKIKRQLEKIISKTNKSSKR